MLVCRERECVKGNENVERENVWESECGGEGERVSVCRGEMENVMRRRCREERECNENKIIEKREDVMMMRM